MDCTNMVVYMRSFLLLFCYIFAIKCLSLRVCRIHLDLQRTTRERDTKVTIYVLDTALLHSG